MMIGLSLERCGQLDQSSFLEMWRNQLQADREPVRGKPAGIAIPGRPAILTGIVKTSVRYI